MPSPSLLFIDFDGVICDSADECLYSSWIAYDQLNQADGRTDPIAHRSTRAPAVQITLRQRFLRLRPFIRSGDDYVLIQRMLTCSHIPSCQEEFDRARQEVGNQTLSRYADALNRVRQELLSHDRPHWLRLNPLYSGMADLLRTADWQATRILSTKSPQYIETILEFYGVPVPTSAILHAADLPKLSMVTAALDDGEAERAVLVDDQIDHLLGNDDERIRVRLATWGYANPDWLGDSRVQALNRAGLEALLTRRQG